jgi:hypothetical protein
MDARTVDNWIDTYILAWRTPGTEDLSGIFTDDVSYQTSPFKPPMKGLKELATFWEESRSDPDEEFTMTHEPVANEGDFSVVKVDVQYKNGEHWKDIWIMQFDALGRCFSFEEWPFKPDQSDGQAS